MPTLPYNLLRVINYAGDPHAPGSQIAATIWRHPQFLQILFCIRSSVTAARNPVNARKSKWTLCFRICLLCRACLRFCIRLWMLTASWPVPQSGASRSASSWRLRGNADKDAFLCYYYYYYYLFLRRPQRGRIASHHFRTGTVLLSSVLLEGGRCVSSLAAPRRAPAHLSSAFMQHSLSRKKKKKRKWPASCGAPSDLKRGCGGPCGKNIPCLGALLKPF